MRVFFTILWLTLGAQAARAQVAWTTTELSPGMQGNFFVNMAVAGNGTVYTINQTQSNTDFYVMYRFFAYNTNGEKIWEYVNDSCFTDCSEKYHCVLPVEGGGALFVGYREDLTSVNHLIFKRFNNSGQLLWTKDWITPYASINPVQAAWDNNGKVVVSLQAYVTGASEQNISFVRLDTATQNITHQFVNNENLNVATQAADFEIGSDNSIYGCGSGGGDAFAFKLDENNVFTKTLLPDDMLGMATLNNVSLDNSGNVFAVGTMGAVAVVVKYNAQLGQQWIQTVQHDTLETSGVDMVTDEDGNVYAASNYRFFEVDTSLWNGGFFHNNDYMITKLSPAGNILWSNSYFENMDTAALQSGGGGAIQMLRAGAFIEIISNDMTDSVSGWKFIKNAIDPNGQSQSQFVFPAGSDMDDWSYVNGYAKHRYIAADGNNNTYSSYTGNIDGIPPMVNVVRKYGTNPTSVSNVSHQLNARIWQSGDELHVILEKVKDAQMVLYDISGRKILQQQATGKESVLSLNGCAAGVYVLHISHNGSQAAFKILK